MKVLSMLFEVLKSSAGGMSGHLLTSFGTDGCDTDDNQSTLNSVKDKFPFVNAYMLIHSIVVMLVIYLK